MRALLVALVVVPAVAHADGTLNASIGAGVSMGGVDPGWAIRFAETMEASETKGDGILYGASSGYDYWRGTDGSGFHIPINAYAGVRVGRVTSTIGAGVGVLALESWHLQDGVGFVPQAMATLGFDLDKTRTVVIDARLQRHTMYGIDDFTTWSVLLMIGKTFGS